FCRRVNADNRHSASASTGPSNPAASRTRPAEMSILRAIVLIGSANQSPFERRARGDVVGSGPAENLFQVPRRQPVAGPDRADVLIRERLAGAHLSDDVQRPPKRAAGGFAVAAAVTNVAERF